MLTDEAYGGRLEVWDASTDRCVKSIVPILILRDFHYEPHVISWTPAAPELPDGRNQEVAGLLLLYSRQRR